MTCTRTDPGTQITAFMLTDKSRPDGLAYYQGRTSETPIKKVQPRTLTYTITTQEAVTSNPSRLTLPHFTHITFTVFLISVSFSSALSLILLYVSTAFAFPPFLPTVDA